jgi:hypothetical protein
MEVQNASANLSLESGPELPVPVSNNSGGFFSGLSGLTKKISDNKMVIYIAIGVIILGVALYFLYFKNKKETMTNKDKSDNKQNKSNVQPSDGTSGNDYYVLDSNGVPVKMVDPKSNKIEPLPVPKQQPSQQDIQMLQKQMMEKQMMEQQMLAQQEQMMQQQMMQQQMVLQNKIKLQHPGDYNETPASEEINAELARIQSNEDDNVAQHNLTNSELAEINHKLEMMNQQ